MIDHSTETYKNKTDWKAATNIKADTIPTNTNVLKQMKRDVSDSQTNTVPHAPECG